MKRKRCPNGSRNQKPMTFRLDNELELWLMGIENKGRYINNLILKDKLKCEAEEEILLIQ